MYVFSIWIPPLDVFTPQPIDGSIKTVVLLVFLHDTQRCSYNIRKTYNFALKIFYQQFNIPRDFKDSLLSAEEHKRRLCTI